MIFLRKGNLYEGKTMEEAVMRLLQHHKIDGATAIEGTMGFGIEHHLHMPMQFGATDDVPVIILFIDETKKAHDVIPFIREIVGDSLIISSKVEKL